MDHPLQLPLDDGNGGFQFMGYGGKEVHPLLFLFPFPLDVPLQLLIGRLQAVQSITQLLGHLVQAGGQDADLIFPPYIALPGHIQSGHPFRHIADAHQRLGIVPGANHRSDDGDQQDHSGDEGDQLQKDIVGLSHRDQGGIGKQMIGLPILPEGSGAAHGGSRGVQILHICKIHGEQVISVVIVDFHRSVVRHGEFQQAV